VRFLPLCLAACLIGGVCLASAAAAGAAETTPSCAEGPVTVDGRTYGTPCAELIVAPPGVEAVQAGGGDDTIVAGPITAASDCPSGCHLGVGSQTFEGGEGDDVVYGERGNDVLVGGPGNDQLFGGIGDDLLQGGPGNDRLAGGFGADSIDGEEGDDYVRGDTTIDRIFDTGGGTDTLSYSTGTTPGFGGFVAFANFPPPGTERGLRFDLGTGGQNANNGVAPDGGGVDEVEVGAFEMIVGTPFTDYVTGSAEAETIYGGGGADAIGGGGGADTLVGGADGDLCEAPAGTTSSCEPGVAPRAASKVSVGFMTPPGATPYAQLYLVGSSGNDSVTATYSPTSVSFHLSAGTFDQSSADAGGCTVSATDATCLLTAPLDSLLLAGMAGADTLVASGFPTTAAVVAIGGEGSDTITGGDTEDILVDGPGSGSDTLDALGGDDALTHNGGGDQLLGGEGNDLFLSNSVCDGEQIRGGNGRDNSSWARFGEGVAANLAVGTAGRPGGGEAPDCSGGPLDSISEVEDLEGSSFDDVFYGDGGPNQLLGHPGRDVYFAAAGEDSILANSGDSDLTINCGADADEATIDRPQYGDPAPVECESVFEADPNNFRTRTLLPPPPLVKPPPPPPVDRRAPQTRLGAHPPARVFAKKKWRAVAFRFTASEAGSRFRCKLDGKPYRGCASPRAYRVKAGRHVFRVFAIDAAGNRDRTPALFRFRVRRR
jgi:RTX calcium-binding nonapeptide repeat (4 copies)